MASKRRKIIKLLLMLLVFGCMLPFVYPWGRPLLSLDTVSLPSFKDLGDKLPDMPKIENRNTDPITIYRWRDKSGNWSFGSEPPQGVRYEAISVNPDANLVQGLAQGEEKEKTGTTTIQSDNGGKTVSVMGYSAEDVSKIMQSAKEARAAMEQRYKQEQAIIESK